MKKLIAYLCIATSASYALEQIPVLSANIALKMAQESLNSCRKDGYAVTTTVVDNKGITLAVSRDEKAGPHTVQASYRKAYTAASTKRDTATTAKLIKDGKAPAELVNLNDNFVFLGGGVPIKVGEVVVGGIGVGGAPGGHLDDKCAKDAINAVTKELK